MMNRKKIFTKKKATGVAALIVALAIILTGTFAWKDFSQSTIGLFSADAAPKHWVSLVDDFQSATDATTNTLTGWKRGDTSIKQVYVTSNPADGKADKTGYDATPATQDDYAPVYVRVQLTQSLTVGNEATTKKEGTNISENQYPAYVDWTHDGEIKTIADWVTGGSQQGKHWILDSDGWLYWGEPLALGEKTGNLLDSVTLLVEPEKELEYAVNITLQAVSADLDSTTGTGVYEGGFANWAIANTAPIMLLFEPFVFTIDTTLDTTTFTPQVFSNEGNNFVVDWGDGTTLDARTNANRNIVHTYVVDGKYTVKIIGTMPSAMKFENDLKLTSVQSGFLENTAREPLFPRLYKFKNHTG